MTAVLIFLAALALLFGILMIKVAAGVLGIIFKLLFGFALVALITGFLVGKKKS